MPLVQNGTVDIGCGPATNNPTRQQQWPCRHQFISQVRMAVRADSHQRLEAARRQGRGHVTTGTTAVQLLRKLEQAMPTSSST
ncbi:MAG: amino acid ABC transporter substrate-binding protein, partial [Burkholderiales bacterium]|nr:amino acid ABC transporter substrate-binding protein [Burkholderiales bacterium]